jgi:hypothetical protein
LKLLRFILIVLNRQKAAVFTSKVWNLCDACAVAFFMTAVGLRLAGLKDVARVMYASMVMFW